MRKINKELADLQANFLQYYRQNLGDKFEALEPIRRDYLYFLFKWSVIFCLGIIAIIFLFKTHVIHPSVLEQDWFAWFCGIYMIVMGITLSPPFVAYKDETKKMVMDKILAFFGDFRYSAHSATRHEILHQSGLIGKFDNQYADDFFSGIYHGVKMQVSNEKLTFEIRTNKGRYEKTVFNGVIIVLDMNKDFSGQTVVRSDWGMFNFLMSRPRCQIDFKKQKLDKVVLEDSRFEKYFETFSNNQVEARYVLTTAFMERILKVKKLFHGTKIEFSFFHNRLFILVPTSKDMFETTSLFTTTARYGKMREVVNQFYSIFSIIDLLKLNKRIGM